MLEKFYSLLPKPLSNEKLDEIYSVLAERHPKGEDPWGLNLAKSRKAIRFGYPVYRNYFRVRVFGNENVEDEPYMVVSNHSGQIPIDGMLISCAFLLDVKPPRILRAMVERFVTSLPFFSTFVSENGAVLGDRANCYHLLNMNQSVLVFPEGVRGISKSTSDYYHLQPFTRGFFRLALKTKTDVLPIAVVGAEEFYPFVYHPKKLARAMGMPALPLSPFYLLGLLGAIPLPSPVDIHIGKPYRIPGDLSPEAPDNEIDEHVEEIQRQVGELIENGLALRRKFFASEYLPSFKNHKKNKT